MKSRVDKVRYRTKDDVLLAADRVTYYEERKLEEYDEVWRMLFVKVGFGGVMPLEGWDSKQDLDYGFYPHVQEKMIDGVRNFIKTKTAEEILNGDDGRPNFVGISYRLSERDDK